MQPRGEYLYAACGEDGVRVFDIAFIDNKSFSERITTAPVSPHRPEVLRADRSTPRPSPRRARRPRTRRASRIPSNKEPKVHPLFGYLYVADKYEGPDPRRRRHHHRRQPDQQLPQARRHLQSRTASSTGASNVTIVGNYAYVCCDAGLVVVIDRRPDAAASRGDRRPSRSRSRSRCRCSSATPSCATKRAFSVLDVTDLARPQPVARLPLPDAHSIYLARTYAYVAAGKHGLVILDIENPRRPKIDQVYNAGGAHQRPARREARHHLCQRVRVSRGRQERHARRATDVAGHAGQRASARGRRRT